MVVDKFIAPLLRKARWAATDPVLRRWMRMRFMDASMSHTLVGKSTPPYLTIPEVAPEFTDLDRYEKLTEHCSSDQEVELSLPGTLMKVQVGNEALAYAEAARDPETLNALHRFNWIQSLADLGKIGSAMHLWRYWVAEYSDSTDEVAWHPYNASERIINLLTFAKAYGLPAPKEESGLILASHGPKIADRLEYFGEVHTGNHLANSGRALFLMGLELKSPQWTEAGGTILQREAERILRDGVLREGSSHYHLLVTRWFSECWLAARAHDHPHTAWLEPVARKCIEAAPLFLIGDRIARIGDISPDCSPEYLRCLADGTRSGWLAGLEVADSQAINQLRHQSQHQPFAQVAGWTRATLDPWQALTYVSEDGWNPMPGHGHQDFGSFEAVFRGTPVIIDPGRGTYGPTGHDATLATSHNTLLIDGAAAYPLNRPYYSEKFRSKISGDPPTCRFLESGLELFSNGFCRLPSVGPWRRQLLFSNDSISLFDEVEGMGRRTITRILHTDLPVTLDGSGGKVGDLRLSGGGDWSVHPADLWNTYGDGKRGSALKLETTVTLPWRDTITLSADSM